MIRARSQGADNTRRSLRLRRVHCASVLASVWLWFWLEACSRCDSAPAAPTIATISAIAGAGVGRDFAARPHVWLPAEVGARLALGDGARTDPSSSAELTFIDGTTLKLKPHTTLRLLLDADGGRETALDVQAGEAVLHVGTQGMALRTHVGRATIAPDSDVLLTRDGQALGLRIALGSVNFRDREQRRVELQSGDSVNVGIGMAVLELTRRPRDGDQDDDGDGDDEEPVDRAADAGVDGSDAADAAGLELTDASAEPEPEQDDGKSREGPSYRHLLARAGESFVVHAPEAPVAIGFEFRSKCAREGLLELQGGRQKAQAVGDANLLFAPGQRAYTLRCLSARGRLGKVVARGSVQVVIDSGTRKLPKRAPMSQIDADGRTYTIYYQNQLPEILVRWPNAPAQSKLELVLDEKVIELAEPSYVLRSGTLGNGAHKLVFQAQSRRSRTTTVHVQFDNVAPKASLIAPIERGFSAGETVAIDGVALPTWKVTVEGGSIDMSEGDRFFGQVQTSRERPDIAVRLSHRKFGTHYYLRRASGSP